MESCQQIARKFFGKYHKVQRFRAQSVQLMCDSKPQQDDTPPKHLSAYPGNVFEEVHYQLQPFSINHQRARSCFGNQDQPKPSGQKWTAKQMKSDIKQKLNIQSQKKFKSMRKIYNPIRGSFGQKTFQKDFHVIKFPSQKAIVAKQKIVSIKNHEKEKYEIEICRIFKKKCTDQMETNEKQTQAFLSEQAMMLRNSFPESKSSTVAFDYDGSLLSVTSPKNPPEKLIIQCTGSEVIPTQFQKLTSSKSNRKKTKQKTKIEEEEIRFGDYVNAESICSKYIQNFRKIPWNSKVSVFNNPKLMNGYKDIRTMDEYVEPPKEISKNLKTCLSIKEEDEKAVVRVFNNEIYNEQLIQTTGKTYQPPRTLKQSMKSRNSVLINKENHRLSANNLSQNIENKVKSVSIAMLPQKYNNQIRGQISSFTSQKDNKQSFAKQTGRFIKTNNFVGKSDDYSNFAKMKTEEKSTQNNKIMKKSRQSSTYKQSYFSNVKI